MIEYKHVALRYTDKNILKDVNLRIENGEFMVLVGPNWFRLIKPKPTLEF